MTEYRATSKNALSFDVTKDEQLTGALTYKSWFQFSSDIKLANYTTYQIEPKGFWGTTIELKEGEKIWLQFQMSWNGNIVIQAPESEKGYVFKHRGIFKESFVLMDQENLELLVMKPQVKWSKLNYEYQIITSDNFENLSNKDLLLMISLHCANYYMSMMMAQ